MSRNRIYVGSIDWKVSADELADHMSSAGEVANVDMLTDSDGRARGVAIVEYTTPQGAEMAIKTLHDTQLGERLLLVREDRKPKGKGGGFKGDSFKGGGGGGNGGGGGGYSGGNGFGKGYGKGSKGGGYKRKGDPFPFDPSRKSCSVYIGNLPWRTSDADVEDLVRPLGDVVRASIAYEPEGRSKGFATVLFRTEDQAEMAINQLNNLEFQGRSLRVRFDSRS